MDRVAGVRMNFRHRRRSVVTGVRTPLLLNASITAGMITVVIVDALRRLVAGASRVTQDTIVTPTIVGRRRGMAGGTVMIPGNDNSIDGGHLHRVGTAHLYTPATVQDILRAMCCWVRGGRPHIRPRFA